MGGIDIPTDTFYRLPEEKRERLIAAIYAELSRVPVMEMSINQIVHSAGISRGSYYQYFKDRDDMIAFLLESFYERMQGYIDDMAPDCGGDPFELLRRLMREVLHFGEKAENRAFCTNLLAHLRTGTSTRCCQSNAVSYETLSAWYDRYFDRSLLALEKPEDFRLFLELLLSTLQSAVAVLFAADIITDSVIADFDRKLEILQRGMLR